VPLGLDCLTFLASTVLVIPLFKSVKASPVLGFLFSGIVLGQLGLFRNISEIEKLSELGVLFLLFEMGLELSLDRLKALAKYAFGLGLLQMFCCTAAFTLFALPVGNGIGTQILEKVFHASSQLASIRSVDEAVVIGVALSLSSSAFVLQLLAERGETNSKFGSATLGILLMQDIAVVPFLVLLPLVENSDMTSTGAMDLLSQLGPTALQTVGSLGLLLLTGRTVLRRVFKVVAESRSDETFVALCLLTVTGASLLTQRLGFSDTAGAFAAGVLLSETNFKSQVEADIRPFRSLLLGLFFTTTGSSMDLQLLYQQWPIAIALLGGLLAVKIGIIGSISQLFGLSKGEAIKTGFLLSQGGEFAFVLLSLAKELRILPDELNRLLIIVVVLSMGLTPALASLGSKFAEATAPDPTPGETDPMPEGALHDNLVVVCGFGELGQTVANMLESPLAVSPDSQLPSYIGFDLQPNRIQAARDVGFKVTYGDGSRPSVVKAFANDVDPRAFVVVYTARRRAVAAVENLRAAFPDTPIYARALDLRHAAELSAGGATHITTANTEAGTALGSALLKDLGIAREGQLQPLVTALRRQMDARVVDLVKAGLDEGHSQGGSSNGSDEDDSGDSIFVVDQTQWGSRSPTTSQDNLGNAALKPVFPEVRARGKDDAASIATDATGQSPLSGTSPLTGTSDSS